jgi:amino acid adenylation domain-containing protein/thioester reductase-like protein
MSNQNIELIYRLSPVQEGMLFHTLSAPQSGMYIQQFSCGLAGELDTEAFKQAWKQLLARHTVLRSAFHWEELEHPLQVVQREVAFPWFEHDWRGLPADEQRRRLDALISGDYATDFDLSSAPLMRWTLVRMRDDLHHFIWSGHHLLADGWCRSLLLQEIFAFYEANCAGRRLVLPRTRPYRDYIAWLRAQDVGAAEVFWRQALRGVSGPTPLALPRPGQSPAEPYAEEHLSLSASETAALNAFARQHYLTLNTLAQGAWALLLSRYSGQDDVIFGATVSGRPANLPGIETMIGVFINTLPVRVAVPLRTTVLEWLRDLQAAQADVRQYEYTPLVQLQGWSGMPVGQPLFESILVFESAPVNDAVRSGDLRLELDDVQAAGRTNYPLTVMVMPQQELHIAIGYDTARFAAAGIRRAAQQFRALLGAMIAAPQRQLGRISPLDASERAWLLRDLNQTALAVAPAPVHERFAAHAARHPAAVAVRCAGTELSYGELDRRSNQLARYLRTAGVGPDSRVAICMDRSADLVAGLLGIFKAGAGYVPLDSLYPADRLAFMLEDARVDLVLTQAHLRERLPAVAAPVLCIDGDWPAIAAQSADPPPAAPHSPEQLAYVIYTSGSTGRPKGVQISQRALVNFLEAMQLHLHVTPQDSLLAVTTLSFDIAGLELWLPLTQGGVVLLATQDEAADGPRLRELLESERPTLLQATPATWRMLITAGWEGSPELTALCGGEALPPDLAASLLQRAATVWNVYGPTETTIWSLLSRVRAAAPVVIGGPLANTQVYVLDAQGEPAPAGIPGELHIGGAGLARGYLGRPALTAEKFIPNPFGEPGSRMYRTGDLVRVLPEGDLEFLERIDDQVKVRGFRIELGEIESALAQHPGVAAAVVAARPDSSGEKRLVAYTIAASPDAPAAADLRAFLKTRLPQFMLPAHFVALEAFPLTLNGKVNRRALPDPETSRAVLERAYVPPATPDQQTLAEIWERALNVRQPGIHDDFFELGGHSMIALQILARIRETFQVRLPLADLLQAPTIAELAESIARLRVADQADAPPQDELDLAGEVALDPAISPAGLPAAPAAPSAVLLTGASGFLGAFLLASLLQRTSATVHCLIRTATPESGRARIEESLRRYDLWDAAAAARIVVVPGDLARPGLGLSDEAFARLAERIDSIIHNGALVNFAYPYATLKPANVLGTAEILRLATTARLKPVHLVSTTSVFAAASYAQAGPIGEDTPLATAAGLKGGYAQSKWVAERLCMLARERGVPVTIYRPGRIAWDSRTGAWNANDVLYRMIKGCAQLGMAPELDRMLEITPVDVVSAAIVALMLQPESRNRTFHLVNPQRMAWRSIVAAMRGAGYALHTAAPEDWSAALAAALAEQPDNALHALAGLAAEEGATDGADSVEWEFDCRATLERLAALGIGYPEADEALCELFLHRLRAELPVDGPGLASQPILA